MKILILANSDVGLYKFRKELIKKLLINNEIVFSTPYGSFVDLLVGLGCTYKNIYIDRRGINIFKDLILLRSYYKLIKHEKPDLVITYTIKPNIYGGFISRILKIPYANNITGLGSSIEWGGVLSLIIKKMYKIALKKAKVIFFENSANRDFFLSNKISNDNQSYLLNGAGVNTDEFGLLPYPMCNEARFLFIGRVMKEKGINELFDAMKRLKIEYLNVTLDIIGNYEEDYNNVVADLQVKKIIDYHGFQNNIIPYIEKAHCLILPSWHEGMANTNLEGASSGRPVITSDIPGCKEAIINNQTGYLCKSKNEYDLYLKMKEFINLTCLEKKQMGLKGRNHMLEKFNRNTVVEKTIYKLFE